MKGIGWRWKTSNHEGENPLLSPGNLSPVLIFIGTRFRNYKTPRNLPKMLIAKIVNLLVAMLLVVGSDAARKCKALDGPAKGKSGVCKVAANEPCVGHFSSSKECKGDARSQSGFQLICSRRVAPNERATGWGGRFV